MKKAIVYALVINLIITSTVFIDTAKADTVSGITETPGAVNCVINFTCNDNTDSVKIYYGKSSPITTGDNETYTDPDEVPGYENRVDREMLIRGLTEDTTYYYRIYSTDDTNWCAAEGSFTTLSRFTNATGWKDEFFDTYLIEQNSTLNLVQQDLIEKQLLIQNWTGDQTGDDAWRGRGAYYCNVIHDSDGLFKCLANMQPEELLDENGTAYWYSSDGISWSAPERVSYEVNRERGGGDFHNLAGGWINISGKWWHYYKANQGHDGFHISVSNEENGTYDQSSESPIWDSSDYADEGNEVHISGVFLDTLGGNMLSAFGQYILGGVGVNTRYQNHKWGYNETRWMCADEKLDIPRTKSTVNETYEWQVYMFPAGIKSGTYIGYNQQYDDALVQQRPYLSYSRNGVNWTNFNDTKPLINLGTSGSFDDELIYCNWGDVVINVGDYDYVYYVGLDGKHGDMKNGSIARAKFRKDGLTAIEPQTGNEWFVTTEIPRWFANNLTINGNFSASAKLNISVLNASTNTPFENYNFSDFSTISTNSTQISCSWDGYNISYIPNASFKLNFSWDGTGSGELYSYSLDGEAPVLERSSNKGPTLTVTAPANGSTGIELNPAINITFNDEEGDQINLSIWQNNSGTWNRSLLMTGAAGNTTVTGLLLNASVLSTKYWWSVNYSHYDGTNATIEIFHFTTRGNTAPAFITPNPANESINVSLSTNYISINISDADGDVINWTIETSPHIGSDSMNYDTNGTKQCTVSGLLASTTYTWYVNATDGFVWNNETYTFNTTNKNTTILRFTYDTQGKSVITINNVSIVMVVVMAIVMIGVVFVSAWRKKNV